MKFIGGFGNSLCIANRANINKDSYVDFTSSYKNYKY